MTDVKKTGRERLGQLKKQIEYCLENYPETRNSDLTLMIQVWRMFYSGYTNYDSVNFSSLYIIPREDSVKRMRCMFTEKGMYLPTTPEIAKKRRIKEEIIREFYGFNPELRTA